MDQALPDAAGTGFEPLIAGLTSPDPDDRHVLAAAIHAKASAIITWNLKVGVFREAGFDSVIASGDWHHRPRPHQGIGNRVLVLGPEIGAAVGTIQLRSRMAGTLAHWERLAA